MKLEVGMYVRTLDGEIIKVNSYNPQENNPLWETLNGQVRMKGQISKASNNIIELIEVGDYVNGSLIIEIRDKTDDNIRRVVTERSAMYSIAIRENELTDNLKSIVTKEQFESIKYSLEG